MAWDTCLVCGAHGLHDCPGVAAVIGRHAVPEIPERVDGWWWDGRQYRRVDPHDDTMSLDTLRCLLKLAGLRIVGEAEAKVLEAIDAMPMSAFGMFASSPGPAWKPLLAAIRELLARRAQQK